MTIWVYIDTYMHCASNRASLASARSQESSKTSTHYVCYRFQNTFVRICRPYLDANPPNATRLPSKHAPCTLRTLPCHPKYPLEKTHKMQKPSILAIINSAVPVTIPPLTYSPSLCRIAIPTPGGVGGILSTSKFQHTNQ